MTKPLNVEMADALAKAANDLGETEEQFVKQAVAQRLEAPEDNPFFARRRKGIDRQAARGWLVSRQGGKPGEPGDELPPSYMPPR